MLDLFRGHIQPQVRFPRSWPMVVLYHGFYPTVDPSDPFLGGNISYQRLARHLELLRRSYRMLTEAEFLDLAAAEFRNAYGTCLVTIDDGYRALCEPEVVDIFAAAGVRPLLFLLAGFLEGQLKPWYAQMVSLLRRGRGRIRFDERLWDLSDPIHRSLLNAYMEGYFLKKSAPVARRKLQELAEIAGDDLSVTDADLLPMSWEGASRLRAEGWGLGSHAWSHQPLARLTVAEMESELGESRRLLEERLGFPVRTCSYPHGSQSEAVRTAAASEYEAAFAVNSTQPADRFQIPRHDLGAYPFHDYLRFRALHPSVRAVLGDPEDPMLAGQGPGARLKQKVEWLTRHSLGPLGTLPVRQLILNRGVPAHLRLQAHASSQPAPFPAPKETRPRVAILCRSNPWNRYAVSRLSRDLDLVGVVVERDPGDPVFVAEAGGTTDRGARCLPPEQRPWYPLDHAHGTLLECTFGASWEAFYVALGTPVLVLESGEDINSERTEVALRIWEPDYIFVFGTSLVKDHVHGIARRCAVNLHNGLSPAYRGSYTLWWPLFEERPEYLGGTLHLLSPKIDGGAVFYQWQPRVDGSEEVLELEMVVQRDGLEHVITLLNRLNRGEEVRPVPQPAGEGALYLAAEFTADLVGAVHAKLRAGLLAEFAREQDLRRRDVPLLISPTWNAGREQRPQPAP